MFNVPTAPSSSAETAQTPIIHLGQQLHQRRDAVEQWFKQQWSHDLAPLYSSVDLRHAGYKLAPVDTNLFPAGFNNISAAWYPQCIAAMRQAIQTRLGSATRLLIIPERHTRNIHYIEHLTVLTTLCQQAGLTVRLGYVDSSVSTQEAAAIELPPALTALGLGQVPVTRDQNHLQLGDYTPDGIILNNDLSGGIPDVLKTPVAQPVLPAIQLGWATRLKSKHFDFYQSVSKAFADAFEFDPWLITPLFDACSAVDFMTQAGQADLVTRAEQLLTQLEAAYQRHHIRDTPFLVIKADQGTYGMAVMMIRDPVELTQLNRKQRTHMSTAKGGRAVHRVLLQEGIYSIDRDVDQQAGVAEPVIYQIGRSLAGGFYRMHTERGAHQNLNAPGMRFQAISPETMQVSLNSALLPGVMPQHPYWYAVWTVARLAALAAGREAHAVSAYQNISNSRWT